jgi:hypothetical protein
MKYGPLNIVRINYSRAAWKADSYIDVPEISCFYDYYLSNICALAFNQITSYMYLTYQWIPF